MGALLTHLIPPPKNEKIVFHLIDKKTDFKG